LIDKELVWQRVGGKATLLLRIIKQFLDFYPGQLRVITEAVAGQDGETLHRAGHRLRGAAANFEAPTVVQAISALESSGQEGDWGAARQHLAQLTQELQQLRDDLQAFQAEVSQAGA